MKPAEGSPEPEDYGSMDAPQNDSRGGGLTESASSSDEVRSRLGYQGPRHALLRCSSHCSSSTTGRLAAVPSFPTIYSIQLTIPTQPTA